jgi:hypothetical protein
VLLHGVVPAPPCLSTFLAHPCFLVLIRWRECFMFRSGFRFFLLILLRPWTTTAGRARAAPSRPSFSAAWILHARRTGPDLQAPPGFLVKILWVWVLEERDKSLLACLVL